MTRTLLTSGLTLLFVLACSGGTESEVGSTTPAPDPAPAPEPEVEPDAPLEDGYAYLPGPDGGAEGARFSRFSVGQAVFAGVDDANLRPEPGSKELVATLPLGSEVEIVASVGEPATVIGRRNLWYRIRAEVDDQPVQGVIFGSILTPYGGHEWLSEGDEQMRRWGVTFSPEGKPRLRVERFDGEVATLDLEVTDRFAGGSLEAEAGGFGDFESQFTAQLCRLDGGEAPACSSGTARWDGDGALAQVTPKDPWKYALADDATTECAADTSPSRIELLEPEVVSTLQTPSYMRGGDGSIPCYRIARAKGGPHTGKELVSCVSVEPGKTGPDSATAGRFLRDSNSWTYLPCASDSNFPLGDAESALVEQGKKLRIDVGARAPAELSAPETVSVKAGVLKRLYRAPPAERDAVYLEPLDGLKDREMVSIVNDPSMAHNAIGMVDPDGTVSVYQWDPGFTLDSNAYAPWTQGCAGTPSIMINVEPEVSDEQLEPVGTPVNGLQAYRLAADHAVSQRLMDEYRAVEKADEWARPRDLELGLTQEQLIASNAWLFVRDPWGRVVRLVRADFQPPAMCEPIVYLYADPPRRVTLAPGRGLTWFSTRPHGPDGWSGLARPDGSVAIDGRVWPELFWEGRNGWFPAPHAGVVRHPDEVESTLRRALHLQGLDERETEAFLTAWMPDLQALHPRVRLAFHSPESIDRFAPLRVDPTPDAVIRVLLDARPTTAPASGRLQDLSLARPPPRGAFTLVEWGGIVRPASSPSRRP